MTQERTRFARTALMMSAAVLLSTPALAQDATTTAAPPVVQAAPPVETVTPPTVVPTVTPKSSAASTVGDSQSATPIDPAAAEQAAAESAERRQARPAARSETRARPVTRTATSPTAAPAAAAASAQPATTPAQQEAPAAQQQTPTAQQQPATDQPAPAAASDQAQPATATTETTQTTDNGPALWPLGLLAALIVVAGIGFLFLRRRRAETAEYREEPVYAEPAYVEPVAAEPIVRPAPVEQAPLVASAAAAGVMLDERKVDHATAANDPELDGIAVSADKARIAEPATEDVAAVTAAETQGNRPWLEFAMRPVRAGTNEDDALVQIELTVGNAGNMDADDVRISTFMLPAGNDSDMERLLVEHHDDPAVTPLTIAAGAGTRVDATLVMPRQELINGAGNATFQPVIVADARYRLPDGGEGRTSAAFLVGGTGAGGSIEPIALDQAMLREDVEAQLYGTPERV